MGLTSLLLREVCSFLVDKLKILKCTTSVQLCLIQLTAGIISQLTISYRQNFVIKCKEWKSGDIVNYTYGVKLQNCLLMI